MTEGIKDKIVVITGASSGLGEASDWLEKVYKPDIIGRPGTLYKKPGYDPRQ